MATNKTNIHQAAGEAYMENVLYYFLFIFHFAWHRHMVIKNKIEHMLYGNWNVYSFFLIEQVSRFSGSTPKLSSTWATENTL